MTPTLAHLTRSFARIGLLSFGGPAAQIALMHREIVDEKQWVSEKDYLSALSFCMLLPGPEAMQLATWIGWRNHGTVGGLIAGGLFVLPGALVVLALSALYAGFGDVPLIAALFTGVQAAIIAVVIEALIRVSKRALKTPAHRAIAVAAFLALFAFALPFPVVILAAGIFGALSTSAPQAPPIATPAVPFGKTLQTALLWGAIWLVPLGALWVFEAGILAEIGLYFSKLAVLTFGGAYAVLAWMAQEVVAVKGWLTPTQMIDGLGLAETTPGPLILVTEFVGFIAAWTKGGWAMGFAGAAVALWMTFAPCFLWIFLGAPYLARLTNAPRLAAALAGIMAAVVGVIANLSLWFGLHVLFGDLSPYRFGPVSVLVPDLSSLRPIAAVLALGSSYFLLRRHWPLPLVLGLTAGASALLAIV